MEGENYVVYNLLQRGSNQSEKALAQESSSISISGADYVHPKWKANRVIDARDARLVMKPFFESLRGYSRNRSTKLQ